MSRPIRIAYPGAWYHVMNRGRRAENIYLDKYDYQTFVDLLQETSEAWNIQIAAYCLMPNHYHMLIQTPEGNISRAMRHVNGVYTQRFNSRHRLDGQLFRGRYKSILVNGDSYLLQLVRYIHRNSLKAKLVENINAYPWSSHKAYLSVAKKWDWLHKEIILDLLTTEKKSQLRTYRRFISVDDDKELEDLMASKRWPSLYGPKDFIDWVKTTYREKNKQSEIPQARELNLDAENIVTTVCNHYKVEVAELHTSKRGTFNEPRSVAIYLIRRLRHDTLREIGNIFNLDKYSSVSSIIERLKTRMKQDRKLNIRIQKLETKLRKSQEQT